MLECLYRISFHQGYTALIEIRSNTKNKKIFYLFFLILFIYRNFIPGKRTKLMNINNASKLLFKVPNEEQIFSREKLNSLIIILWWISHLSDISLLRNKSVRQSLYGSIKLYKIWKQALSLMSYRDMKEIIGIVFFI